MAPLMADADQLLGSLRCATQPETQAGRPTSIQVRIIGSSLGVYTAKTLLRYCNSKEEPDDDDSMNVDTMDVSSMPGTEDGYDDH